MYIPFRILYERRLSRLPILQFIWLSLQFQIWKLWCHSAPSPLPHVFIDDRSRSVLHIVFIQYIISKFICKCKPIIPPVFITSIYPLSNLSFSILFCITGFHKHTSEKLIKMKNDKYVPAVAALTLLMITLLFKEIPILMVAAAPGAQPPGQVPTPSKPEKSSKVDSSVESVKVDSSTPGSQPNAHVPTPPQQHNVLPQVNVTPMSQLPDVAVANQRRCSKWESMQARRRG